MFLILPHSAEIRHGRMPWVVIVITLLCIGIFLLQDSRNSAIEDVITPFCEQIHDASLEDDTLDFLRSDEDICSSVLFFIHNSPRIEQFSDIIREDIDEHEKSTGEPYTQDEVEEAIALAYAHYNSLIPSLPPSLDARLVYDPIWPNPIRSILSGLSHADWWHLIGNLIFFFAFAMGIEFIIASTWRFILAIIGIKFCSSITYSLTVMMGADPLPTLGLSGVVFGMIGMSTYLMPNVRIRTFVWIVYYARNIHIPAVVLAIWYIGFDTYYLFTDEWSSGINLVAHVSGGVAGYFIARQFFRKRREETKDEIDEEVEYMRSLRQDKFGIMSSFRSKNKHQTSVQNTDRAKRDYAAWVDSINSHIDTGRDAEAINLILSCYDEYRLAIELYEELYREMLTWPHTRAILCLSRLLISEYLASRKYAKAIQVAQTAYKISEDFVFADDKERELLEVIAQRQGVHLSDSKIKIL